MKLKIKLKKSNLKSLEFLIAIRVADINQQIQIWTKDEKMNIERKNKLIAEEVKNAKYWEGIRAKINKKLSREKSKYFPN